MFKDYYELKTFYFYKASTKYLLPCFKPLVFQREHLKITNYFFFLELFGPPGSGSRSWFRIRIYRIGAVDSVGHIRHFQILSHAKYYFDSLQSPFTWQLHTIHKIIAGTRTTYTWSTESSTMYPGSFRKPWRRIQRFYNVFINPSYKSTVSFGLYRNQNQLVTKIMF